VAAWTAAGIGLMVWLAAAPARGQEWISYNSDPKHILEGNWQSCQQSDGRYAEKIYDHYLNSVPQYEVHLGPRHEFAIFKGVQDDHRDHDDPANLLKPYRVIMDAGRAKQHWEVPSLNLSFTVSLGGGSTTDCESWYILLTPLEKPSH
jgi:hypothetical protein